MDATCEYCGNPAEYDSVICLCKHCAECDCAGCDECGSHCVIPCASGQGIVCSVIEKNAPATS